MTEKSLARSVIDWLRAGYPGGVPGPDRVPLLALLRNTPLTEEQVKEVVREIGAHEAEVLEDGVIRLKDKVDLPDGTELELTIRPERRELEVERRKNRARPILERKPIDLRPLTVRDLIEEGRDR